jgi:hypothetical protein
MITHDVIVPHIEENIPLPHNAAEALPSLTPAQELTMRANVAKLVSDLTGQPISPTEDNKKEAIQLAQQMVSDPQHRPQFAQYKNETLAYLAGMVAQMNTSIVDELSELKLYVVNKLLFEIENTPDSKSRLSALRSLGEIDGVDAFKKRSEVTVKVQPIEEVEQMLFATIESLAHKTIESEARQIVDAEYADNASLK